MLNELGCRDTEGLHALVAGVLNDVNRLLGCRYTEGLHALTAGGLNDFK
jgi:hypothetical protein